MKSFNFSASLVRLYDFNIRFRVARYGLCFIGLLGVLAGTSSPALAYVDPGVGGMLIQLLLGGVAGLVVIMRLYWERIRNFWSKILGKPNSREGSSSDGDDDRAQ